MQPVHVVLLQSDPATTQTLIAQLCDSFRSVGEAQSVGDLRASVAKRRAEVVILDMEVASLSDLEQLSHEFPRVSFVCTHRLADEQLWAAALQAGAADCCPSYDTQSILKSAIRHTSRPHSQAA